MDQNNNYKSMRVNARIHSPYGAVRCI